MSFLVDGIGKMVTVSASLSTAAEALVAHLDVGVQRVGPKDGAGTLIALHGVLLEGGHIAAVCVGEARNHHCHVWAPHALHLRAILNSQDFPSIRSFCMQARCDSYIAFCAPST